MAHFAKDVDNFSAARTVKIVGSESIENYTLYSIELTVGPYSWTVRHRYSDFHDLHEKLVSSCKLERSLLPPKKLFGNQSEAFIKRRLGDLETYLQTIMYFLVNRLPPPLAAFLDFNKYEIHGVTHALAEELYNRGDLILQAKDTFQMSPLQLYALTERLKLPEPTCDSGDLKKDIGHILDFITRLKYLKIVGTRDPVGTSNIDMNLLKFDLTLFKSLQSLETLNCNVLMIQGLETVKQTLRRCEIHHSVRAIRDILLQELPHWRAEDGTMLISPWERLTEADFSHNNIIEIDDSVQLLQHVEYLDLGHNVIETINHIQWLSQLRHLNLSHNSIRHLDALHTKLGNLKTLNLSGNKLESLQGFSKLFSLEVLNVSNNDISQIGEVRHINNLPCLESVLLLGNPVTIVPDYRNKVLEIFGDRANEISLDNRRATQKELDTVAVLQAIQKARDGKDRHKLPGTRKAVVTEVPVVEPGPSAQMSSSHDSTTAVIGWSVTDAQSFSSDPDIFRLQVEAIREQGGEAWLTLLNELQTNTTHRHQARELLSALSSPASSDAPTMSPVINSLPTRMPPAQLSSTCSRLDQTNDHAEPALSPSMESSRRSKSLGGTEEGFKSRFIDQEKLPGIGDGEFVKTLQSQLLSVELMFDAGREDVEQIRQILWCYAIQFSRPMEKQVACVALTDRHVFIQRLKGITGKINAHGASSTSETETFYIMPMFNIQKVVVGREQTCVRLEEAFVGANGTFTLIGLNPEAVRKFVTTLQSMYQRAVSGDGLEPPDLLDLSQSSMDNLKLAISNTEKTPDPKDIDVIFSSLVFVSSQPSCLVLTDHTFYMFSDNCVQFPPPTFEVSDDRPEQYRLLHRFPVMTKIGTMELFNSSGKGLLDKTCYTSLAKKTDAVQYEHYGISLSLELDDSMSPLQTVEIVFLTAWNRDEFLEKLTQLRYDNAQKMSPTHRGEPEGGNETSETDSSEEPKDTQEGSDIKVVLHQPTPEGSAVDTSGPPRKTTRSFTSLELGYPGAKLVSYLTRCIGSYSLVCSLPPKLKFLVSMSGKELVTYFHSNMAEIGFENEELRHVAWVHVVPYSNPRQEILSLLLLTTRAVYMLSDDHVREPHKRPSWMAHTRHKSDSVISRHQRQKDHHHTSGILHTGDELSHIPKPFKILRLCDIKLVNVGLFDQYFRLTGRSEENVFTVVTRDCYGTEEFIKQLTQVLSLVSASPTPDVADEPDFYRTFAQRTKSTIEGLEYTLPSKVKFCYPGEESLSDLTYLINDSLGECKQQAQATHVWIYLLGYVYMGQFSEDAQSQAQPRGIILTNKHICMIIEDLVSYPLPDFVRGLPESPRQEVMEGRKVEYLKEVTIYPGHCVSLLFSDETEEITVDTSFEHYGVERAVKGRESPPQIVWTLFIQSAREKEKFVQLLGRQWSETHDGLILPTNTVTEVQMSGVNS